jgi:hypothetical protein
MDALCKHRKLLQTLNGQPRETQSEVDRFASLQWVGTKVKVGYERFADAKAFLVPSHGRQELVTKPRPDGKHWIPTYLVVETPDELEEVLQYTDHSVAVRSKELVSCPQFAKLIVLKHHVEVVGCALKDASVFANVQSHLDLRDNEIEDVTPLARVTSWLWLSRNKIQDVRSLQCKHYLFLDHNRISNASCFRYVKVLDLRGNPLADPENAKTNNTKVFVD